MKSNDIYSELQKAFEFYNKELFEGKLPQCVITLQRNPKTKGYFAADRFIELDESKKTAHEIALNPEYFGIRKIEDTLSTLVHEMCHLYCEVNGKNNVKGYHSKQWAEKMEDVGLLPTSTGKAGGKKTGYIVTHIIIEGGDFSKATKRLLMQSKIILLADRYFNGYLRKDEVKESFESNKIDIVDSDDKGISRYEGKITAEGIVKIEKKNSSGVRIKYSCDCCNVWGMKGLKLYCSRCNKELTENNKS